MAVSSSCGDNPAPKHFENLRENKKVNCLCYTHCKQELQELLLELKCVTKNINIPKDGPNCDMNQTNEFKKCHILSSQLQEAVTELKSAQFVIKLLQDEVNKSNAPRDRVESNRQDISEFSRQEWKSASNRYSNKFAKRFKYITPHDITTKNRFEVLSEIQSLTGNAQG